MLEAQSEYSMKLFLGSLILVNSRATNATFKMFRMIKYNSCQMFYFMEAQRMCPKITVLQPGA